MRERFQIERCLKANKISVREVLTYNQQQDGCIDDVIFRFYIILNK